MALKGLKPSAEQVKRVRQKQRTENTLAIEALKRGDAEGFHRHADEAAVCASWIRTYV
jgi:hypothetical protein